MTEMLAPTITAAPNATVRVLEGESVTLNWTYTLNAGFLLADVRLVSSKEKKVVEKITSGGTVKIDSAYHGRITADITDTFTFITFLAAHRNNTDGYKFGVNNLDNIPVSNTVQLVVECKYDPIL